MKRGSIFLLCDLVLMITALALLPGTTQAERLSPGVIALFPQNLGEFAYADLKAARSEKQLAVLEAQFLPGTLSQIQTLLADDRIDLLNDADEVAWGFVPAASYSTDGDQAQAASGEQIVGVALGQYNPESTALYLKQKKAATIQIDADTAFALQGSAGPNDLFFVFLDSNTLAFGHRAALQKMLQVRAGISIGIVGNTSLYQLIDENNGSGALWAVLDPNYSQSTMSKILPDIAQSAQSSKLLKSVNNLVFKIDADGGMQGQFQIVLSSPDDANVMAQLMQIGLVFERYQATSKQNKPLSDLLGRAQIFPSGERVTLHLSVNEDEVSALPTILSASNFTTQKN
jgi:hypothetical protein